MKKLILLGVALGAVGNSVNAWATEYTLNENESLFTVLTHKGGLAAGMAHNHVVHAKKISANIDIDTAAIEKSSFRCAIAAQDLEVDEGSVQTKIDENIAKYKIYSGKPFSTVSESDRVSIRKNMLSASQLDAAQFPEIKAAIVGIHATPSQFNGIKTPYTFDVDMTLHGKTVRQQFLGTFEHNAAKGELIAEAIAVAKFSQFGITPYSAMLGAVKNLDDIHFYILLKASKK